MCDPGRAWDYGSDVCAACEKETDDKSGGYLGAARLAAILSGAVPKFSGWSSRLSLGSLAVLLLTGFLVVWGMYQMTIQISSLLMKNQELAMQVSLLNQENERIIKELERLTGKQARDL